MNASKNSVHIHPFAASAAEGDVLDFVQPFKPIEIHLRSTNKNDPNAEQFALVDFADQGTALSLIAKKLFSVFMGQSMRLRLAVPDRNNNESGSMLPTNMSSNRSSQGNRSTPKSRNFQYGRSVPKENHHQPREIQKTPREIVRGTFELISSVNPTHFVAQETGWRKDMEELCKGLEDFASFAKCGVDKVDPGLIYACKEPVTGKWRRCRKVADEGDAMVVDLIDIGVPIVVTNDQVLYLSQLYREWSIKSVDVLLDEYVAASESTETFKKIEDRLLGKTFQIAYMRDRTGPLMRDHVRVQDMQLNGASVLEDLIREGLLLKREPPRGKQPSPTNTPLRPITKSVNTPRTPPAGSPLAQRNVGPTPSKTCSGRNDAYVRSAFTAKKTPGVEATHAKTPVATGKTAAVVVARPSPAIQKERATQPKVCDGVHSGADGSNRTAAGTKQEKPSTPALQREVEVKDTSEHSQNDYEPSLKLKTLEKLIGGRAAQRMIRDRIDAILTEQNETRMRITSLPVAGQPDAAIAELRHNRRLAQRCTQELEEILQLASQETLEAYHLGVWAQFVGHIWSPMMSLDFFNEHVLGEYKNSVIRRVEIEMSSAAEDDPETTVVLELVIEPEIIFKFVEDLSRHKNPAKVHRVFFSEDNCKAFVVLACPGSDASLEEYGRNAVDFMLESGIIQ